MLHSVHGNFLACWQEATKLDQAATFWARITNVRQQTANFYSVSVAVHQARYDALTKGLRRRRQIELAIQYAMEDVHREIRHNYICARALEGIPVCKDAVFGPLSVIVEWPYSKARDVKDAIDEARDELACIEMTRLGEMRAKSIVLALSLPISIFDATVASMGSGTTRRPLNACLYEVICERRDSSASDDDGITDLDVPF